MNRDDYGEVGRPYEVNCTVYTGTEVNYDNVNISWSRIRSDGTVINDSSDSNSRITVIPTTSNGYIHTKTLRFSNISEEDENTSYNCTASLYGDHELLSKSFTITILTCKLDYCHILYSYIPYTSKQSRGKVSRLEQK